MRDSSSSTRRDPSAAAEEVFFRKVQELGPDAEPDLEELCVEHPELADDLRDLHRFWQQGRFAVAGSGAPREADLGDLPSLVAGRYEPQRQIDAGGMGVVLEVWDQELRRSLAMKVVRGRRPADPAQLESWARAQHRLRNEARILGDLVHPGIVPVHDVGETPNGDLFFAMQLVEGRHLEDLLVEHHGGHGWSLTRLVEALLRVCEAVAYAHARGIVHRDLKPRNVMVGPFGETYVLDWGLAARLDGPAGVGPGEAGAAAADGKHSQGFSRTRGILGSPGYLPPEQASDEPAVPDPRADVYSAGAILYHLLAGRRPYADRGAAGLHAWVELLRSAPPTPLAVLAPRAPAELVAIAEHAMARRPDDRYPTIQDLAADLRAFLEGRVVRALESGAVAELRKWILRNRAAAVALLVLVLGTVAVAVQQNHLVRAEQRNNEVLRGRLYSNGIAIGSNALQRDDVLELRKQLDSTATSERGWEWHCLDRLADTSDRTFTHAMTHRAALSPDGSVLVSGGNDGILRSWRLADGAAQEHDLGERVFSVVFRDARHVLAGLGDGRLIEVDLRGGKRREVRAARDALTLDIAPDGRTLAVGCDGGTLALWDAESMTFLAPLSAAPRSVTGVAFSSDGALLIAGCREAWPDGRDKGTVQVYEVATRLLLHTFGGHDGWVENVAVQPGGRLAASAGRDGLVRLWDLDELRPVGELPRKWTPWPCLGWADKDHLLTGGTPSIEVWSVPELVQQEVLVGHVGRSFVSTPVVDGQFVSSSEDGKVKLWSLGSPERIDARDRGHGVHDVAFRPGTRQLAVAGASGFLEVWDADRRRLLHRTGIRSSEQYAAYSSDGAWLYTGDRDGMLRVWPADRLGDVTVPIAEIRAHDRVKGVAAHPEQPILATCGQDGFLRFWHREGLRKLWEEKVTDPEPWPFGAHQCAFSPRGHLIAVGTNRGMVQLYSVEDGSHVRDLVAEAPDNAYTRPAFSRDGRWITACIWNRRSTVAVWRVEDGELLWQESRPRLGLRQPLFSEDGSRLFAGSQNGGLHVFDARTGERLATLPGAEPQNPGSLAVRGGLVVLGATRSLRFWDGSPVAR